MLSGERLAGGRLPGRPRFPKFEAIFPGTHPKKRLQGEGGDKTYATLGDTGPQGGIFDLRP